jgi:TnpA family transposase
MVSENALAKVSADLNAEWAKKEATQKEYLDKMVAHTTRAKHSLSLDKMMGRTRSSSMGESGT